MNKSKILAQFIGGFLGCIILLIASQIFVMTNGINGECSEFVHKLIGIIGYKSCVEFGLIISILFGTAIGVLIISKAKITNYIKISILLTIITLIIPLSIGILIFGQDRSGTFMSISNLVFKIFSFSVIPSLITTTTIILCSKLWKKLSKKIKQI